MSEWVIRDDGSWQPVESSPDALDARRLENERILQHIDAARQQIDRSRRLTETVKRMLRARRAWRLPTSAPQQ